jgi:hypothetical protein
VKAFVRGIVEGEVADVIESELIGKTRDSPTVLLYAYTDTDAVLTSESTMAHEQQEHFLEDLSWRLGYFPSMPWPYHLQLIGLPKILLFTFYNNHTRT